MSKNKFFVILKYAKTRILSILGGLILGLNFFVLDQLDQFRLDSRLDENS